GARVEASEYVAGEPVIALDNTGTRRTRTGNRSPLAAPQGVYRCEGNDRWGALSVSSDERWGSLVDSLGAPAWTKDEALARFGGRMEAHDSIDAELESWCANRDADDVATLLSD